MKFTIAFVLALTVASVAADKSFEVLFEKLRNQINHSHFLYK